MNQGHKGPDTEDALAFFGSMTAGISHDLNNVLAIIHQVNGLFADLCLGMETGRSVAPDRLRGVQERIDRQVTRGGAIIKRLNRFAHSVDESRATFDLGALVEDFCGLRGRLCERYEVVLSFRPPEEPLSVTSNPFLLLMMLSSMLERYLVEAESGDSVQLTLAADGDRVRLEFEGRPCSPARSEWSAEVDRLAAALGGSREESEGRSALTLSIILPR